MEEADPGAKLEPFQALIGEWTIEMTHPMVEDRVVRGRATYEWLEGGRFLIQRAVNEHPDFPDSLCVIGVMEGQNDLSMQYFDSRGVHRVYAIEFDGRELILGRDAPGFAQRANATLSDDGSTLAGIWLGKVYVHVDLDVLDTEKVGKANEFATEGGPNTEELQAALGMVPKRFAVGVEGGMASCLRRRRANPALGHREREVANQPHKPHWIGMARNAWAGCGRRTSGYVSLKTPSLRFCALLSEGGDPRVQLHST